MSHGCPIIASGTTRFPAPGYYAVSIEAVTQFALSAETVICGVTIQRPTIKASLVITAEGEVETLFDLHADHSSVTQTSPKTFESSLSLVNAEDEWTEHMLAELEGPIFTNMTNKEMHVLNRLSSLASSVSWITPAELFSGNKPEYSSLSGMMKAIMKAQPALRHPSIDVDSGDTDHSRGARLILQHEVRLYKGYDGNLDNQRMVLRWCRIRKPSSCLLVGYLGGLGRSRVRWMFSQGARHFVFHSRSGTYKPEAEEFVSGLEQLGGQPIVLRGDVSIRSDVDQASKQAKTPIRRVMQLVMALTIS